MSKIDTIESMPYREHTLAPIKVSGTLVVDGVLKDTLLRTSDCDYRLAKKKDSPMGGIRYYSQWDGVNKFTALVGTDVTIEGVLDTFQDYGSGETTIRVIRGPKVVQDG